MLSDEVGLVVLLPPFLRRLGPIPLSVPGRVWDEETSPTVVISPSFFGSNPESTYRVH